MGSGASAQSIDEDTGEPNTNTDNNNGIPGTDKQNTAENTNDLCSKIRNKNALKGGKNGEIETDKIVDDANNEQRRNPKVIHDQSYEGDECIIAIKDEGHSNWRQQKAEFEISTIPHNEIVRQREEEQSKEETERLRAQEQDVEERREREARVDLLKKRLDVVFKRLLNYGGDGVFLSQGTIDVLSNLVRKFHARNTLEYPLPILEKKHHILEKIIRRRKRRIRQLQTKYVEATPTRLKQTNPEISELSGPARAHNLANQLSALYDEERKHTFAEARLRAAPHISDGLIAIGLHNLFQFYFKRCQELVDNQSGTIIRCLTLADQQSPQLSVPACDSNAYEDVVNEVSCRMLVKEFQKYVSKWSLVRMKKDARKEIYKDAAFKVITVPLRAPPYRPPLSLFLDRCAEIGWFSQILIPALSAECSRQADQRLMYTANGGVGSNLSGVVWPVLVQPCTGVLVKGVSMYDSERDSGTAPEDRPAR